MATEAKLNDPITKDAIDAYLDRMWGLEEEARSIMGAAMKECKDGPRAEQKDLRKEIKSAGINLKAFDVVWQMRKFEEALRVAIADLEDEAREQLIATADAFGETGFGQYLRSMAVN